MRTYSSLKPNFERPYIWRKSVKNGKLKNLKSFGKVKKEYDDFLDYRSNVFKELNTIFDKNINTAENLNQMSMRLAGLFEHYSKALIFDNDIDQKHLLEHTNKITLNKKLQPWCKQLNMNVNTITHDGYGIMGLVNKYKNVPAFVIAAGPSLKNNIQELRKVGNKGIIIAVDTSFRPVLNVGVEPHLVMAHDANHNGAKFFLPEKYFPPNTNLNDLNDEGLNLSLMALYNDKANIIKEWSYNSIGVFVNYISPLTITSFCGDMICFYSVIDPGLPVYGTMALATNYHIDDKGGIKIHNKGGVLGGSSVGHTAFYLAHALGCNPISLVGLDLSYPEGKTYVDGASNQKDLSKIRLVDVEDISNRPVKTNISMFSYRTVFENMLPYLIMQSNIKVFNCTEHPDGSPAGILEIGAEPKRLKDVIEEYCKDDVENIINMREIIKQDRDGGVVENGRK